jgi:hypothetical protein
MGAYFLSTALVRLRADGRGIEPAGELSARNRKLTS